MHTNVAESIHYASNAFQQDITLRKQAGLQLLTHNQKTFFGVKLENQQSLDFEAVKLYLKQRLERPIDVKITQIVGDSLKFSETGVFKGIEFLDSKIDDNKTILLYGYNGRGNYSGCDGNQVVNFWIDHNPQRAKFTVANIVERTAHSITSQDAVISIYVKNFFLVHKRGGSSYGDDIPLSDGLMEKIISLDGGAQTFQQLVNALDKNIPIEGIYNLRGENNPELKDETGNQLNLFSATEFLAFIKQRIEESGFTCETAPDSFVELYKEEYFASHPPLNPTKSAYAKKLEQLNKGWTLFFEKKLWKHLESSTFEKANL